MELEGQIEDIIYQNETNSYTIAELVTEKEVFTIVGYLPFINNGDCILVKGKFVTHQDYGRQFKVEYFEKKMPETKDALEKYLGNGIIKGIGPATARKIVDKFGDETIAVFKFEPSRLAEVKGITKERAIEIAEEFNEKWELWQIVGFLEKFGISANNSKKVYDKLGNNAIEEIQENPYILVDIVYGVDFFKIDKIAIELGTNINSFNRIKSGIKYALLVSSYNGNTCTLKESLVGFVKERLRIEEEELIEENLKDLSASGEIVIEKRDDEEWIYLIGFYQAEKNIAERIYLMENSRNIKYIEDFEKELKKQEKNLDIKLSEKQKEALNQVNDNNVSIITGGPGTGKTTIIKTLIDIYKNRGKKVVLCAPTGRAAKKMTESTGEDAKTIHRLLEIGKFEEDKLESINQEFKPIDGDIIVIDEMSMVDVFLMNYITKAIYLGTKLVLVGDSNQLSSVGPGNILKDIIDSGKISTVNLDKIFRQAAKSDIIVNAHKVNNGENFLRTRSDENKDNRDCFFIQETEHDKIISQLVSLCTGRLKKYGNYDFYKSIQVLTPTRKGNLGIRDLNNKLQEYINPKSEEKKEKKYGEITFREGDRVMQIKNNYDIFWDREIDGKYENGTGIFNGDIGQITKIDETEKQLRVEFDDGKKTWYMFSELDQLELAYSITIHKSQGSEFDVVIMVLPQASPMLLTRNLLYTGITRAKKILVMIGNGRIIDFMVNNVDSKKRNTGLKYKIDELLKK